MKYSSYRDILHEELVQRKRNNPAYSVRAFARDLGITSPRLNNILNSKEGLSVEAAKEIAAKLKLTDKKKKWFYLSVGSLHARSEKERIRFKEKIIDIKEESKVYSEITLDYFEVISKWYHFAILEVMNLSDFQYDIAWIAKTLEIKIQEAQDAIDRLKKLGLVQEQSGRLIRLHQFVATPNEIPSDALKMYQREMIEKGLKALVNQDVDVREFSINKMTINRSQLPELKQKLKDLRREFVFQAEKAPEKDAVYTLNIQFFDLTPDHTK